MPAKSPLHEIRHRLFRLFGDRVTVPSSADIAVPFAVRDAILEADSFPVGMGATSGLIGSRESRVNGGDLTLRDGPFSVQPAVRGGCGDDASVVSAPAISSAHLETPSITPVALEVNAGRQPQVHSSPVLPTELTTAHRMVTERISAPIIHRVDVVGNQVSKRKPLSLSVPKIKPSRVRLMSKAKVNDLPLERRRLPMPAVGSLAETTSFLAERVALSRASSLPSSDIKLIGVYCLVPLGAASRMDFDEESGALVLLIRDDAQKVMSRMSKPVVTIVMGREKETGRIVRAVMA